VDFIEGNRRLKDVVDAESGLFGYVSVDADYPDESLNQMRTYLTRKEFVAILLGRAAGGVVSLEIARELVNANRRYTKPLAIFARDVEGVIAARRIAEAFPQMKIVMLGMGGAGWRVAVEAAKACLNIYLEISGNMDADKIDQAVAHVSSRRILYGSGLPHADPHMSTALVASAKTLTETDRKRILIDNALGLYQIYADVE
jgi:predicted TIM-barrel fold metal-dependent hydrolase